MPRDYAPREKSRRPVRSKGRGNGLPGWVWMIAGLSLGLAVAAFIYVSRPGAGTSGAAQVEPFVPPPQKAPTAAERRQPVAIPPREKPRFTFYELLPNQEVVIPREPAQQRSKAAPPPPGNGSYVIQVASFRSQADADRQKASLALLGIESKIESVTIDNRDTYYRVRVGPEKDWNRVQMLMGRLEDNGIQSLLVKVQ